ncbi:hypothetical protein LP415_13790 [Polaromonas sp. P1(28)-8]|nr:hypothetical protein LP415_13790 [Polaromonas sp. P1(28)-8]
MTENSGTSFSKKPLLYAMAGVHMPNYLNYVSLDALKAVSPAAVTVIH